MTMDRNVCPNMDCNLPELWDISSRPELGTVEEQDIESIQLYLFMMVVSTRGVVHVSTHNERFWQGRQCSAHLTLLDEVTCDKSKVIGSMRDVTKEVRRDRVSSFRYVCVTKDQHFQWTTTTEKAHFRIRLKFSRILS